MAYKVIDVEATSIHLKNCCKEKGIKAKDIQVACLFESRDPVYKWFSTRTKNLPTLDHFVILADLLDCKVDDLLVTKERK